MSQFQNHALADLEARAEEIAGLLKLMSNKSRLLILCRLSSGKASVSELCAVVGLSQSAISQHLAKMRRDGLVKGEKDGLQINYSITDPRCLDLLAHLSCQEPRDVK
ncbi:winged helix-turn-helix transcriptional regulator [Rhodophyticola sp. DY48A3-103]|mgnify:FL=1|jgi:DNA-binding transcriptional ArsR family regulator|nr:winged helix-turn-helix transcriptional regulator [Alterinioella nitratireducens]|tara:strand:+ start:201 stop:521 length:321 start_codon:yes stop_codon:yes gene_type:complete